MKQLKGYEAEIIALKTQLKAEKHKRNELERALATVQRSAGQDAESTENLKRRLHELASLKESYQGEVHQLKRSLERAQSEKDAVHRQRDEAIKRVSMLMKCQEQMKSTVESHTVELIEEIETLQSQLDDERKRTTVFLGNEKTLLRDITEKNATITRLQQTVTALQQQERELQSGMRPAGLRKNSPRDRRYASFPSSTSPTAGAPTTPKTSNCSEVSSSTQELNRILGSLERISEFSARSPSASFAP
jgi:chromosome segregation ATPase